MTSTHCHRCTKDIQPALEKQGVCETCFFELIEHRAGKVLKNHSFKKGDNVLIIDDNSKESAVTNYLFRKILSHVPLTIETQKQNREVITTASPQHHTIIIPWDLEDEAAATLTAIVNKEPTPPTPNIKLLKTIHDHEIKLFADLKHFTYTEHEQNTLQQAFRTMQEKHPNTTAAFVKSIKQLQQS